MFLHATDDGILSADNKDQKLGEDGRLSHFLKDSSSWFSHALSNATNSSRDMQTKTDDDRKCEKSCGIC